MATKTDIKPLAYVVPILKTQMTVYVCYRVCKRNLSGERQFLHNPADWQKGRLL